MSAVQAYGRRRKPRRWSEIWVGAALMLVLTLLLQACADGQGPDAVVHVVELTPAQSVVLVGDTVSLTASAKGSDGSVRQGLPLAWSTRHPDVVSVAGSGSTVQVVALKAGLAEISAGTHGKTGLATLEVRNRAPVVSALQPAVIAAGGPGLVLVVTGSGFAADAQVVWQGQSRPTQYVSAQELRATIASSDIAVPGAVQVGVYNPAPGGGSSSLDVVVAAAGEAVVQIEPGAASITAGQSVPLHATVRDIFGNDLQLPVTWSSENDRVAMVTQAGVVAGVAIGTAVIRAVTATGTAGYAAVTVNAPPITVPVITSITPDSVESGPNGLEITIRGTGFMPTSGAFLNWSSRSTEYVSATELRMHLLPGDLNASGTRQVYVFNPGAGGGSSAPAQLRIVPGVWRVQIAPAGGVALWPGQEQQLAATAYDEQNRPLAGRPVTWRSSDTTVVRVDATGRIRALAPGYVTIDATIGERTGFIGVQVYAPLPYDLLYEGTHGGYAELWLLTLGPDAAPRRILPAGTYASDPAASPDGSRIAFVGLGVDGARNIFVVNRDGTNLRQLTHDVADDEQPAWSRDGARIAFRSTRDGVSDIFVMYADGSGQSNVTRNVARGADGQKAAERPTWTPDGRIVFTYGYALLNPLSYHLVSVQADGSDWKALTDGSWRDYEPEVSPDGRRIALRRSHREYDMGEYIDIITADGSQLGWISLPGPGRTPSWSPDGAWLTFSQNLAGGGSAILMGQPNGGQRVIVPSGGRNPVWIRR